MPVLNQVTEQVGPLFNIDDAQVAPAAPGHAVAPLQAYAQLDPTVHRAVNRSHADNCGTTCTETTTMPIVDQHLRALARSQPSTPFWILDKGHAVGYLLAGMAQAPGAPRPPQPVFNRFAVSAANSFAGAIPPPIRRPLVPVLPCPSHPRAPARYHQELLARSRHARDESLWTVAQALSEILPEGDQEKHML